MSEPMLYDPGNLPDQNIDPPEEDELTDWERQDAHETEGDRLYHLEAEDGTLADAEDRP